MAKEEKTKTDIIREALAKWPELSTTEVAAKINRPGITMAYVSSIKSQKKQRKPADASGRAGSRRGGAAGWFR